jgi:hypothetical protein
MDNNQENRRLLHMGLFLLSTLIGASFPVYHFDKKFHASLESSSSKVCDYYFDQSKNCDSLPNPETCRSAFKVGSETCDSLFGGDFEPYVRDRYFNSGKAKCDLYQRDARKACLISKSCEEIPSDVTKSCLQIVDRGYGACMQRYGK